MPDPASQKRMRWTAATQAIVLLVATACTSTADPSTTTTSSLCSDPPSREVHFDPEFEISLDPNPVDAGAVATLSVDFEGQPPSDYIGGAGASWECWNGSAWVETHILVRAFNETVQPSVIDLPADSGVGIPDIGLTVPNSYQVMIPDVASGTYRITDRIFGRESMLISHVAVEVQR